MPIAMAVPVSASVPKASITQTAQAATSSQEQQKVQSSVKKALKSTHPTTQQKEEILGFLSNYEAQTQNANPEQMQAAKKTLLESIYNVLTPAQQTQFKASLKQSLGS